MNQLAKRIRRARNAHDWMPARQRLFEIAREDARALMTTLGRFQAPLNMKMSALQKSKFGIWHESSPESLNGCSSQLIAQALLATETQRGAIMGIYLTENEVDAAPSRAVQEERLQEMEQNEDEIFEQCDSIFREDLGLLKVGQ